MAPIADTLRKLNPWAHKAAAPAPPPITTRAAAGVLVLYALSYFVPFYLSPATRPSPTLSRDAPSVIRARIRFVTLSSLLCTGLTYVVLSRYGAGSSAGAGGGPTPREVLHQLGLWPLALWDSLRVLLLTALLFAGPLFRYLVVDRGWSEWVRLEPVRELFGEWTTWRNIIAGPLTEEILFRTASIPLLLLARTPPRTVVLLAPLVFGLAHVHHFYEFRLTHPRVPAAAALLRSLAQLAYTTLFGAYASFLFLRAGSLAAPAAAHAFCNCMGLPQVWGRVEPETEAEEAETTEVPQRPVPVPVAAGGETRGVAGTARATRRRPSIMWSVAYYVLLVAGAVLWYRNLWVLSESDNALVPASAFSKAFSKASA